MKLRKLMKKDSLLMHQWMHDFDVVEHLNVNFMQKTLNDCKEFIRNSWKDKNNLHYAIVDNDDIYVGTVSLKNIDYIEKNAEFAIVLSAKGIGKGYASYAIKEMIKIGFEKLKLDNIYWYINKSNKRSIRFCEKNGYNAISESDKYFWYSVKKVVYFDLTKK